MESSATKHTGFSRNVLGRSSPHRHSSPKKAVGWAIAGVVAELLIVDDGFVAQDILEVGNEFLIGVNAE